MTRAIRIHETGGPEVLRWEEVDVAAPAANEVLLRQTAVGLNYIDTYHRTGLYPLELPTILGREAAGVVEAVGDAVDSLAVGDRVAYALEPGAYCETRVIDAGRLVRLPDPIEDATAAAMVLKGLTAQYLLRSCYRVESGDTILIHAAAGGVGLIACQWAKALGATVIGTVGSTQKAELAAAHGCDHPILYKEQDFVERVRELTGGAGVKAVYDSVGRDTFDGSLDCLETRGTLVSFGQSSGPVEPFNIGVLAAKGSLSLTRPTLADFIATSSQLASSSSELFDLHISGALRIEIGRTYPLSDAAQAHRDLEARKTSGSTVLLP
ncbi:MAG: NADPH:quinone reductase [Acidobacteria bacterium]|nr:NADPH:quinone reductase [Acidobacteriota bacterium]NIM61620.1 NADPH:quinone reductase [Acidobacteriota bacterium]NIO58884.1 NADPH:quinone reductase [Acidobacteriota bacterium]NIQ29935.1 NADPH:quinone reductase [Acidobacteriota bacterium]NIQ87428.1 NADPH:quinone reductase [Acidobacteriota bacterium]